MNLLIKSHFMRKNLNNENQTIKPPNRNAETARLNWGNVSSPVFSLSSEYFFSDVLH
jgi:hypothetical protein